MSTINIFAGKINYMIATKDATWEEIGFNSGNINIVREEGHASPQSWNPLETSALTGTKKGVGYSILPKVDIASDAFSRSGAGSNVLTFGNPEDALTIP